MLPPGLQAGSATPTEGPKQRFLKTNYIVRQLASGLFATVYISIPKIIADQLISDTSLSPEKLHSALRQNLQAAKISKSASMAEEISLLKAMKVKSSSSSAFTLPNLLDSDPSSTPLWLTLQYLNGGTLQDLLDLYYNQPPPPPLPTSLLWHWISQMAQTLLSLHQGLTIHQNSQGKPELVLDENWVPTIHNDIHRQNLIFNTTSTYPDLILSDFGNSIRQDTNPYGFPWTNLKETQISSMLCEVEQLANKVDRPDDLLSLLFEQTPNFRRAGDEDAENDAEREFLEKVINLAEKRKKKTWRPMPDGLKEYFENKGVKDEELEGSVKRLREKNLEQELSAEASSSAEQDEKTPGCGCATL
ncbi:hypothetical protein HII31_12685 [Pseudocercospora fuligena]|uniref:Protein kinase domain-containing protein n=1 Tax=Pseudocercospora fuligena TaxID=685502 RepID=A0A8H6VBD4_9PEZI|nr:hypothetical protein HII31_12685 [Pseudocercospora fuligena]